MENIPKSEKLINLILSKTQRKTPTIIHKNFPIVKIRNFYIRKVKFVQNNFEDFLSKTITGFPILSQLHPFFADFFNILFDKNCYKIALDRLFKSKLKITNIAGDYVKLIKYGKTLYSCKQLKKIAIGKIVKIVKKLNVCLIFLEKVRLYLVKIPSINPHKKTLLITGSSGVGKSSFMNKITKAGVKVAFDGPTTKSILVGHFYDKFYRWQVIDSPGIDKEDFENFSSAEIQTINVLAHLDCTILYILDPSEISGLELTSQIRVFFNLRKCFKRSEQIIFLSKTDLGWEKILTKTKKGIINRLRKNTQNYSSLIKISNHDEVAVFNFRQKILTNPLQKNQKKNFGEKSTKIEHVCNLGKKEFENSTISSLKNVFFKFRPRTSPEKDLNLEKNPQFLRLLPIIPDEMKEFFSEFYGFHGNSEHIGNVQIEKEIKLRELGFEKNYINKKLRGLGDKKTTDQIFTIEKFSNSHMEKIYSRINQFKDLTLGKNTT